MLNVSKLHKNVSQRCFAMNKVTPERSGFRDLRISAWHRLCGVACIATDLDFLLAEAVVDNETNVRVVALIEYKHEKAPLQKIKYRQFRILKQLGDRASLPVFCFRYKNNFSGFRVVPINDLARNYVKERCTMLPLEVVELYYKLRGLPIIPQEVIDDIEKVTRGEIRLLINGMIQR